MTFKKQRPSNAGSDITLLQNLTLMEEVERLTLLLQRPQPPPAPLSRLVTIFRDEVIRGGWPQQKLFVAHALHVLAFKLFRLELFPGIVPYPSHSAVSPHETAPIRYARLKNGLGEWRSVTPSEAQRTQSDEWAGRERLGARATWELFVAGRPDLPYLASLEPHRGKCGKLRILILLGGGGLGDALLFSPFLAALQQRLAPCEIVLMYGRKIVEPLYAGNPNVACALSGPWEDLQQIGKASRWLGIFDLFVDIFCFLPRYLICERSRIDLDCHGTWLHGNYQLSDLIDRFSSNLGISLLDRACNVHVFDLLAAVGGLPLTSSSPVAFFPTPEALATVRAFNLPESYVTVRDGSNPGDLAEACRLGLKRTTKQLSESKWAEITTVLRGHGLNLVQVGDSNDLPIDGVDIDLRGRTQLSELCFVMKGAVAHVDTEGGLVHFARASNVRSIVFFGPTSNTFFGYPSNFNLSSPACGRCWYSNETWIGRCPRSPSGLPCTEDLSLDAVRQSVAAFLIGSHRSVRPVMLARHLFNPNDAAQGVPATSLREWAFAITREWMRHYLNDDLAPCVATLSPLPGGAGPFGLAELASLSDAQTNGKAVEKPASVIGSIYNMPVNDDAYDLLLSLDVLAIPGGREAALSNLLRMVRPGGLVVIAASCAAISIKPDRPQCLDVAGQSAFINPERGGEPLLRPEEIVSSANEWAEFFSQRRITQPSESITWAAICLRKEHSTNGEAG